MAQIGKKKILLLIALVIILAAVFTGWKFFGPTVRQPEGRYLFVPTGTTLPQLKALVVNRGLLSGDTWFSWTASAAGFEKVRPGRYEINDGMSVFNLVRMLKNGRQSPVDLVITKIRTKEVLAGKIGKLFECDSLQMLSFLNNPDSMTAYGLDTNTAMAAVMPLTYTIRWNTDAAGIFRQFHQAYNIFWTDTRKEKAAAKGLSRTQVSTLASIVDEETNAPSDKPNIASTYLNRINTGMPLQADPTVKFAMKNFALRRILNVHLQTPSPYNTYVNKGLPPGPICTPAASTIDSVLNAPDTKYIYFVANSAMNGTHIFTTNYADHLKYARLFQAELNKRNIR